MNYYLFGQKNKHRFNLEVFKTSLNEKTQFFKHDGKMIAEKSDDSDALINPDLIFRLNYLFVNVLPNKVFEYTYTISYTDDDGSGDVVKNSFIIDRETLQVPWLERSFNNDITVKRENSTAMDIEIYLDEDYSETTVNYFTYSVNGGPEIVINDPGMFIIQERLIDYKFIKTYIEFDNQVYNCFEKSDIKMVSNEEAYEINQLKNQIDFINSTERDIEKANKSLYEIYARLNQIAYKNPQISFLIDVSKISEDGEVIVTEPVEMTATKSSCYIVFRDEYDREIEIDKFIIYFNI